ncbi:Nuf2 family protein [Babesia bovis T2Bo]|uniref:Kinetochore protein Nuf2 N-terminal domain-containing protein n=1 Tax=Babesia bovis TaxID=5865 RepID=A7AQ00_BABBO|nr:Nuf2 family protein [Babesia bovis T2Bo]EDO08634.1 Nuf2 family protein [Babesia bovis T2Bo]|eukprot:XP_001612202.1 hypothetical protein [Babesia bovis T2Bo]
MDLTEEPQILYELFRKVRVDEVVEDLKELGVDVREETLKNPTPEAALCFYGLAIQVVFGKTRTDIRPEDVYSHIHVYDSGVEGLNITSDNLEFLKRGIGNLRFWRYCQKLHETLGLQKIERYEIFNPTPESFHRFISAFVVYRRFREALKSLFEDSVARLNFCVEQDAQLDESINKVRRELQNLQRLKDENLTNIESSVEERAILEHSLLQAKNVFNDSKDEKAKLDGEIEHIKLSINEVQLKKTKSRHLNETLSEQVVVEPDALYNQKNDLEAEDSVATATLNNLEERFEDVIGRIKELEESSKFLVDMKTKLSQHVDEVLKPLLENNSTSQLLQNRNETLREQISQQKCKLEEAKLSLTNTQQQYEDKMNKAKELADAEIKQAHKFAEEIERDVQGIKNTTAEQNDELSKLSNELVNRERYMIATFASIEEYFSKVKEAAEAYKSSMDAVTERLHSTVTKSHPYGAEFIMDESTS